MAITPGLLTSMLLLSAKAVLRVKTALANRRAAKELTQWDDAALKDIGLTRSDVRGALAESFLEDPTLHLSMIAAGRSTEFRRNGAIRKATAASPHAVTPAVSKARLGNLPSAEPALCA